MSSAAVLALVVVMVVLDVCLWAQRWARSRPWHDVRELQAVRAQHELMRSWAAPGL